MISRIIRKILRVSKTKLKKTSKCNEHTSQCFLMGFFWYTGLKTNYKL